MAQASEALEGAITFRRNSRNPCICIKNTDGTYSWINFRNLSGAHFEMHRSQFHAAYKDLQKEADDALIKYQALMNRQIIYLPHPHERQLMQRMFERLPMDFRRQLLIEYKHTVIGESWCHLCMKLTYQKDRCLHFDCPGMCEDCYMKLDETCPACHRKQEIDCPICREPKTKQDLHTLRACHHSVCHKCFTLASLAKKPLLKCPVCRLDFAHQ